VVVVVLLLIAAAADCCCCYCRVLVLLVLHLLPGLLANRFPDLAPLRVLRVASHGR
jgi:hypothetical protein